MADSFLRPPLAVPTGCSHAHCNRHCVDAGTTGRFHCLGRGHGLSALLVAKWFVIWSVGARLLLAGLRQILQPRYTAEVILSLKHEESHVLVRELGFANLAVGLSGLASALFPAWTPALALTGGVFYSLAGINHMRQSHRSWLENIAMVSDLFVGLILLLAFVGLLL